MNVCARTTLAARGPFDITLMASEKPEAAMRCRLSGKPELAHHADNIVKEILFDDLAVVPAGDRTEVDFESLRSVESSFHP
jgi:hypothetical protein